MRGRGERPRLLLLRCLFERRGQPGRRSGRSATGGRRASASRARTAASSSGRAVPSTAGARRQRRAGSARARCVPRPRAVTTSRHARAGPRRPDRGRASGTAGDAVRRSRCDGRAGRHRAARDAFAHRGEPAVRPAGVGGAPEHRQRGEIVARRRHRLRAASTIAASGQQPPGRDVALGGVGVARLPKRTHDGELPAVTHTVDAGRPPPRLDARRRRAGQANRLELLPRPFGLAGPVELAPRTSRSVDQQLDVQRRVGQPVVGQRPGGPVGRGVALLQPDAQMLLDHGAEGDPFLPSSRPASSVSNSRDGTRPSSARHGRSWLAACRIHSASAMTAFERGQVGQRDRIDQRRAGARRGAAGRGRRAGCSGSRRRARRRAPPGRERPPCWLDETGRGAPGRERFGHAVARLAQQRSSPPRRRRILGRLTHRRVDATSSVSRQSRGA